MIMIDSCGTVNYGVNTSWRDWRLTSITIPSAVESMCIELPSLQLYNGTPCSLQCTGYPGTLISSKGCNLWHQHVLLGSSRMQINQLLHENTVQIRRNGSVTELRCEPSDHPRIQDRRLAVMYCYVSVDRGPLMSGLIRECAWRCTENKTRTKYRIKRETYRCPVHLTM